MCTSQQSACERCHSAQNGRFLRCGTTLGSNLRARCGPSPVLSISGISLHPPQAHAAAAAANCSMDRRLAARPCGWRSLPFACDGPAPLIWPLNAGSQRAVGRLPRCAGGSTKAAQKFASLAPQQSRSSYAAAVTE